VSSAYTPYCSEIAFAAWTAAGIKKPDSIPENLADGEIKSSLDLHPN
jgi:hypothetical protein